MSNSRIIFRSVLRSSRRPSLGFAASSLSSARFSPLPLPTALNPPPPFELKSISSFTSSFTRRLFHNTASVHNKNENHQQEEEELRFYGTAEDDGEFTDEWEEEDETVEPKVGDGGDGGGIVLQGVPWGESALSIAHDALKLFSDDIKLYAFKTTPRGYIYVRLDKLSDEYGCPSMEELQSYTQEYKKRLDEAGERREIPDDLALQVSSPGAERILKVPDDLDRFKDMAMRVCYIEDAGSNYTEKSGVFLLDSVEEENCVWKLAEVKENRDPNSKGRPFSRKQKDWRLKLPFDKHKMIMLYLEY
ncbi:uncharacterized protein LOC108461391 isoform X1 [Gossypium arboreum]|uniref:DUF7912 domain-containing protein n=1 Tax=Gossypium arboreum TaxID=29729 RepID=A0ABR0MFV0_GOSAR|nr:uncharacterized protein LOC108461391 isoform X1 [Gossypium arboreum]XP_017616719.1 uncharacterized protein LOC108461391 isoform X1 [Gossypium arboreum]KAK5771244.1 hypothetical protein PVK06_047434 [Gossypium arboreum]